MIITKKENFFSTSSLFGLILTFFLFFFFTSPSFIYALESETNTVNTTQRVSPDIVNFNINKLAEPLPPISVQPLQDTFLLAPYMRYAQNLQANDPQSAYADRKNFKPYESLQLERSLGTYWFLVDFVPVKDSNTSTAYLDIGNFLPKNSKILVLPKNSKNWQLLEDVYTREKLVQSQSQSNTLEAKMEAAQKEVYDSSIFNSGLYDLTSLRNGGVLLIYSPGMPSLWFSPTLTLPAKASISIDRRVTPFLLISLVLLMVFSLWRGLREEGDARLWASLLTFFALIEYIWGVPENPRASLQLWDMIGVVSASCALFLIPHIGRHYMVTEKQAPNLDGFLQFIALPAIFPIAIIFVPLPEYFSIIRFAPVWGIYAFLPLLFCIPAFLRGYKGVYLYTFFCLSIGLGALLGFFFRENAVWHISPLVGLFFAMISMFLAPRQSVKNTHEVVTPEEIVSLSDFAKNSIPMREAFLRIETKLREPFDNIMREACFLDFDSNSEDFIESLQSLSEKQLGQKFDKNSLNAIDDLEKRAIRLKNHSSALVQSCKDLSSMLGLIPQLAEKAPIFQPVHELINIKNLIQNACDSIREEAQDKQIGLGWYIAPQMGLYYRGDVVALTDVLELLLKDAVRATHKGMISLRVRRANSPNPGHIVFTISDSGKGRPPLERSPLTLIKAWELSTNYNGQVELNSSPAGLSFSFSMECVAMDDRAMQALSFASLDDVVLQNRDLAISGGNIVFSKESAQEEALHREKHGKDATVNWQNGSGQTSTEISDAYNKSTFEQLSSQKRDVSESSHGAEDFNANIYATDIEPVYQKDNRISILLISPLAIQRQNLAWYLNQYELWEALDVDSALAFYEKKPARLVLVHSALSASGCNAVLAGIRLLEDTLGISHAPFLGLYQSAKDMEFLRLAGCQHLLPANIGREDLCTVVAEIMDDPFISPILDIEGEHTVNKKKLLKVAEEQEVKQAVQKRLNMKREYVGQVVDGLVQNEVSDSLEKQADNLETNTVLDSYLSKDLENANSVIKDQENFIKPYKLIQKETDFEETQNNTSIIKNEAKITAPNTSIGSADVNAQENSICSLPENKNAYDINEGVFTKFLQIIRPKPVKSLQDDSLFKDRDYVSDPVPLVKKSDDQDVQSLEILNVNLENDEGKTTESDDLYFEEDFVKKKGENSGLDFEGDFKASSQETTFCVSDVSSLSFSEDLKEVSEEVSEEVSGEVFEEDSVFPVLEQSDELSEKTEHSHIDSDNEIDDEISRQDSDEGILKKSEEISKDLTFLPSANQMAAGTVQYAKDEDIPTYSVLADTLLPKKENLFTNYHDITTTDNIYVQTGIISPDVFASLEAFQMKKQAEQKAELNIKPAVSLDIDPSLESKKTSESVFDSVPVIPDILADLAQKDMRIFESQAEKTKEILPEIQSDILDVVSTENIESTEIQIDNQPESTENTEIQIDNQPEEKIETLRSLNYSESADNSADNSADSINEKMPVADSSADFSVMSTNNDAIPSDEDSSDITANYDDIDAAEIIELTPSMLVPTSINPDSIPKKKRNQNAANALMHLDLELPFKETKTRKKKKTDADSDVKKVEVVSNLELRPAENPTALDISSDSPLSFNNEATKSEKKTAKTEQLSFFPTDDE